MAQPLPVYKSPATYWLGILIAGAHLYANTVGTWPEIWVSALHFGTFGLLAALIYPIGKRQQPTFIFDVLFGLAVLGSGVYLVLGLEDFYARGVMSFADKAFAVVAILGGMILVNRTAGAVIPVLILIALSYVALWGQYVPGVLNFPGLSWETVLTRSYFEADGMFGPIARISSTYVFMFILFGAFLVRSGAGDFVIDLARLVAGRIIGGPGFVAVLGSSLTGTVTGSAVANTVTTGVFTIPLMRRAGYRAEYAAGIEAASSTGGQLMPPVMGAGAFIMASYTQVPYIEIITLAALPALLYFLTVAFFVRIEARRQHLLNVPAYAGEDEAQLLFRHSLVFIIPIITLVVMLVLGFTPVMAAGAGIVAVIVSSWLGPKKMGPWAVLDALSQGARNMASMAVLLVSIGLIVNVVATTGLGQTFSLMAADWSGGNLLVALVLIALASLVLGMGLPVTAAYIVLATLSAPMLAGMIEQSAYGPGAAAALVTAHMIIFWLSQDSNITPPVCLAAYSAAAIGRADATRTGLAAWRIGKALYIIPILFAFTPLLSGDWLAALSVFIFAVPGLYALAGALEGHLEAPLDWPWRLGFGIAGIGLLWPLPYYYHLGVLGLFSVLVLINTWYARRRLKREQAER